METWKGFTVSHLEWAFGVSFTEEGIRVPYRGVHGDPYREKLFSPEGRPLRWLGEAKPQVPYGLETLALGGSTVFITEGESCCWALRACFLNTPVLGIPGASSWKPEWRSILADFRLVYLSFDNDAAGVGLTDAIWPYLPHARRVLLPKGEDTRDVLQLRGEEAFERLLDDADYIAAATQIILNHNRKDSLHDAA